MNVSQLKLRSEKFDNNNIETHRLYLRILLVNEFEHTCVVNVGYVSPFSNLGSVDSGFNKKQMRIWLG